MPQNFGRGYLYLLVTVTGFTTLGVELSASRLLDPWFGNSMIVWASLIGLILLYLAAGYWLGGRLADRSPNLIVLLRLTALGALGIGLVPVVARPVLGMASSGIDRLDAGLLAGSMLGILALFALPITLLGCVGPFAIRLGINRIEDSGAYTGRIYALSTAGSIMGSFLPVLLLIPAIGTRRTFASLSVALLLVVLLGLIRARRMLEAMATLGAVALVLIANTLTAGPIKQATGLLYETESPFNYIMVVDAGPEVQLRLNEGEGIHSVYRPSGGLAYGIWDYFLLAPAFSPAPHGPETVKRVYIAGLAAGTAAALYTDAYGPVAIDGAELDPKIIEAGRRYFNMNQPNLNAVAADARRFLNESKGGYDVVVVDAYRPPYIPFHLTTMEFFRLVYERLAPGGVVAVNVGRTHTDYRLVDAIAATLGQVFPSVYIVDEPDAGSALGNSMVVATREPSTMADFEANLSRYSHPLMAAVADKAVPTVRAAVIPAGTPIFTDDRAPVEQIVHSIAFGQLLRQR